MAQHPNRHPGGSGLTALLATFVAFGLNASPVPASAADSVYWSDEGGRAIRVANLDGSGVTTLFDNEDLPCGLAIDAAAGKIYWTTFGSGGNAGEVRVGPVGGSMVGPATTLFTGPNAEPPGSQLCGVAINPATQKIYWANFTTNKIRVGNLAGTGASDLFTDPPGSGPSGVAIDPATGTIYWTNQVSDEVRGGPLGGSMAGSASTLFGVEFGVEDNPIGVAIADGNLYWTDLNSSLVRVGPQGGSDSGPATTLFTEPSGSGPGGVAIDPTDSKIYWDGFHTGTIRVGPLGGFMVGPATSLPVPAQTSPLFVALLRAPVGTAPPTISGTGELDQPLSCTQGDWAPDLLGAFLFRAPRSYAYQWQKDGVDIGANDPMFTPTETGSYTCQVTATNGAGSAFQPSDTFPVTTTTTTSTTSTTTTTTTTTTSTTTTTAASTTTTTASPTTTTTTTTTTTSTTTTTAASTTTTTAPPTTTTTTTTTTTSTTTTTAASTTTTTASPTTTTTTTTTTSTTTTTTFGPLCAATPAAGCRIGLPLKSLLQIDRDMTNHDRDRLKWKWGKGALTSIGDFADPVNGSPSYRVCLYDASANPQPLRNAIVLPGGTCGTKPCWKPVGGTLSPKGYSYTNKAATPDGITDMKLQAGTAGKAKLQVKGKGADLALPPLALTLPATMQLTISNGITTQCWQTTFGASQLNTPTKFKAKGP